MFSHIGSIDTKEQLVNDIKNGSDGNNLLNAIQNSGNDTPALRSSIAKELRAQAQTEIGKKNSAEMQANQAMMTRNLNVAQLRSTAAANHDARFTLLTKLADKLEA